MVLLLVHCAPDPTTLLKPGLLHACAMTHGRQGPEAESGCMLACDPGVNHLDVRGIEPKGVTQTTVATRGV